MRICLLVISCSLLIIDCAAAQSGRLAAPDTLGPLPAGGIREPLGSAASLKALERSALAGDRRASALLAVLLQEMGETDGNLLKAALHLQVAIAAGCSDLDAIADHVVARLTPADRAVYGRALPRWVAADSAPVALAAKGRCLAGPMP